MEHPICDKTGQKNISIKIKFHECFHLVTFIHFPKCLTVARLDPIPHTGHGTLEGIRASPDTGAYIKTGNMHTDAGIRSTSLEM